MTRTIKKNIIYSLALLPCFALATEQAIEFQADSIQYNNKLEINYLGNVVIKQGDKKLTGNSVKVTQNSEHDVKEAILTGTPAHLEIEEAPSTTTHANANKIILLPEKEKILLIGNSIFHYDHEQLSGNKMTIHLKQQTKKKPKQTRQTQKVVTSSIE
jgi:lipopolysaccharide transport protein LptA